MRRALLLGALAFGLGLAVALVVGLVTSGGDDPAAPAPPAPGGGTPGTGPDDPAALAEGLEAGDQVAQLFLLGFRGRAPDAAFRRRLRAAPWGGVVLAAGNYRSARQLRGLTATLTRQAGRAGRIGPLLAAEQLGGEASAFADLPPETPAALGAGGRPGSALVEAERAGRALRSAGLNATLAPSADVATAAGPFGARAFSEDPEVVARFVAAALEGYRRVGVVAAVSQFPGAGAASQDPALGPASVGLGRDELRARDVRPFEAVAEGAPAVVVSNAVYAGFDGVTPATLLPDAVDGLLRGELGFRGVVVSGDLVAAAEVAGIEVAAAAVQALEAGADLLHVPGGPGEQQRAYAAVLDAVRRGRIPRERLVASVVRVLALKRSYRLIG